MANRKYSYTVLVQPLVPPIGNRYRFAAKVDAYRQRDNAIGEDPLPASPIGEVYGTTEEEARRKATERMEAWIAENS